MWVVPRRWGTFQRSANEEETQKSPMWATIFHPRKDNTRTPEHREETNNFKDEYQQRSINSVGNPEPLIRNHVGRKESHLEVSSRRIVCGARRRRPAVVVIVRGGRRLSFEIAHAVGGAFDEARMRLRRILNEIGRVARSELQIYRLSIGSNVTNFPRFHQLGDRFHLRREKSSVFVGNLGTRWIKNQETKNRIGT